MRSECKALCLCRCCWSRHVRAGRDIGPRRVNAPLGVDLCSQELLQSEGKPADAERLLWTGKRVRTSGPGHTAWLVPEPLRNSSVPLLQAGEEQHGDHATDEEKLASSVSLAPNKDGSCEYQTHHGRLTLILCLMFYVISMNSVTAEVFSCLQLFTQQEIRPRAAIFWVTLPIFRSWYLSIQQCNNFPI